MQTFTEQKRIHATLVARFCSYLNFGDILTLTKVNRRLYFVTGDIPLLCSYNKLNDRQFQLLPRAQEGYEYKIISPASTVNSQSPKPVKDHHTRSVSPASGKSVSRDLELNENSANNSLNDRVQQQATQQQHQNQNRINRPYASDSAENYTFDMVLDRYVRRTELQT